MIKFPKKLLSSETHWRPTYLIGDWHAWSETHQRPTFRIGDQSEVRHAWSETLHFSNMNTKLKVYQNIVYFICVQVRIGLRMHVGLRWVSNPECWSPASWTGPVCALPRRQFEFPKMGILSDPHFKKNGSPINFVCLSPITMYFREIWVAWNLFWFKF